MASRTTANHPKTSKAVLERQRITHHLLADLEAFEQQGGATPGLPAPSALLHGLAPWLRRSIRELVALDERVFGHRARLTLARQERDAVLRQLARDVAALRISIENQYRTPQIRRLGFESPTPRSPEPLLRVATRVVKNLALPGRDALLGQPWYEHPFDPTTHQAELARQARKLRRLLQQVDHLQRDLDLARIRRGQAQQEHDILVREARQVVQSVERLNRLAHDQASRNRQPEPREGKPGHLAVAGSAAAPRAAASKDTPAPDPGPRRTLADNRRHRGSEPAASHRVRPSLPGSRRDPIPRPGAGEAPPGVGDPTAPRALNGVDPLAQGERGTTLGERPPKCRSFVVRRPESRDSA